MDGIKKEVTLLSGQNKTPDPSGPGKSIVRIIVAVLVIAGLAWLAFTVVRDLIIYGLYFRYVDELAAKTGSNQYLINALAAVCLAPFLLGVKYYFFSLSRSKRSRGAALLLGMIALYNMALYVATKDDVMGKFYTITTEGVRFPDRVLGDGREWKNVNRDNIWYVTHLAVGKKVDATGRDWFDQKSGLPLLWYSKLDSQIQFYDGPGFDRFTAEPLKPVTKELYLEWKRSAQSRPPAPASAPEAITNTLAARQLLGTVDAPVDRWSDEIKNPLQGKVRWGRIDPTKGGECAVMLNRDAKKVFPIKSQTHIGPTVLQFKCSEVGAQIEVFVAPN